MRPEKIIDLFGQFVRDNGELFKFPQSHEVTQEYLKDRYQYNDLTGNLEYRHDERDNSAGDIASWLGDGSRRHRMICIRSKNYTQARLNWMYHYGEFPERLIHLDGDSENDRISNLRSCTQSEVVQFANERRRSAKTMKRRALVETRDGWVVALVVDDHWDEIGRFSSLSSAYNALVRSTLLKK